MPKEVLKSRAGQQQTAHTGTPLLSPEVFCRVGVPACCSAWGWGSKEKLL